MTIKYVVIPRLPSVFSAQGLLFADMNTDFVETVMLTLDLDNRKQINQKLNQLLYKADLFFERFEVPSKKRSINITADLRYLRQNYELNVKLDSSQISETEIKRIRNKFHKIHEAHYGHYSPDETIQIVNLRILASEILSKPRFNKIESAVNNSDKTKYGTQNIWVSNSLKEYSIYRRNKLQSGHIVHGPAIIQEEQATTLVKYGWQLEVDIYGNLIMVND
jgi:N-methylhydantoinase A